jgi:hypothetical protein
MNGLRNSDIYVWFEGKLMHLEDIKISEVSQAQKKGHIFSLMWEIDTIQI